ncbi:hypothetical protein [Haliangium ochraceum]|uniref:hypothetical protein n=1 Tax=Haliangium ochraceum TaxID=80816 RepID=UPI0018F030F1|nr:hypothetical protein [Haliangium ochraceum]
MPGTASAPLRCHRSTGRRGDDPIDQRVHAALDIGRFADAARSLTSLAGWRCAWPEADAVRTASTPSSAASVARPVPTADTSVDHASLAISTASLCKKTNAWWRAVSTSLERQPASSNVPYALRGLNLVDPAGGPRFT